MVVNAPPEFYEVKRKVDSAKTPEEKLRYLEELLKVAPKHKGAQKLLLWIKREIKKYRELLEKKDKQKRKKFDPYSIKKEGDATVSLLGIENSGKSYILAKLTGKKVNSTEIPFETTIPEVGILKYNQARIQIVEIPSFMERGAYTILRNSNLILLILDCERSLNEQTTTLLDFLNSGGIFINKKLPKIKVIRKYSGGISITGSHLVKDASEELLREAVKEMGYQNVDIVIYEECKFEDFITALEGNVVSKKALIVLNRCNTKVNVPNSVILPKNPSDNDIEILKGKIWEMLNLIRIYTKSGRKVAKEPLILKKESVVRDAVEKINRKWLDTFDYAIIEREGIKKRVGLEYSLEDGDILEIKIK